MACHAGRAHVQSSFVSCHSRQGQPVQQKGPDIGLLEPALQKQFDQAANAHLGNIIIKAKSNKKVHWTCDKCPDGHLHSWEASVSNRTAGGGCPQCRGRKVCKHNSLATKAPGVAAQWDYQANNVNPDDMASQSHQVVGWLCDACGHEWTAKVTARVSNCTGCPQCAKGARIKHTKHPNFAECGDPEVTALLAEWDHRRNDANNNFPDNTTLRSSKQIWWLCTKCPVGQQHSWSARPASRTGHMKAGCAICAGKLACKCNSLQTLCPGIAAEWAHGKDIGEPSDHTASSIHLAWWSSPQRGSWQQTIDSRTKGVQQKAARLQRTKQRQGSSS